MPEQTLMPKKLPLTGLEVGRVPQVVLVCGDPGRAEAIARQLEGAFLLGDRREYRCYVGSYQGRPVGVCSHGIGAPGAAIAFEELIVAGATKLIRVGTCGSLQPSIGTGDLVVASAAVQNTGYGRETVPAGYPAAADPVVTLELHQIANRRDERTQMGVVLSRDNFYRGVRVDGGPDYEQMSAANVLAVEMECAALFIVGSLRGVSTGAILAVDGNVLLSGGEKMESYRPDRQSVHAAVEMAIQVALEAAH